MEKVGIFDLIWPNFWAPQWGFWPKILLKSQMPHIARGPPPLGLNIDRCITTDSISMVWWQKVTSIYNFSQFIFLFVAVLQMLKLTWNLILLSGRASFLCISRRCASHAKSLYSKKRRIHLWLMLRCWQTTAIGEEGKHFFQITDLGSHKETKNAN